MAIAAALLCFCFWHCRFCGASFQQLTLQLLLPLQTLLLQLILPLFISQARLFQILQLVASCFIQLTCGLLPLSLQLLELILMARFDLESMSSAWLALGRFNGSVACSKSRNPARSALQNACEHCEYCPSGHSGASSQRYATLSGLQAH